MSNVETKMGQFASAHNELVDVHNGTEEELQNLKCKLADFENQFHRNSVKYGGIEETFRVADLQRYI